MTYIGPPRSNAEMEQAWALACRVFAANVGKTPQEMAEVKGLIWNVPGDHLPERMVVLAPEPGSVAGVVRLPERTVHRGEQAFSCVGITSVCLDEAWRGRGLSKPLMEHALATAATRGELALLFARRAVDHYYLKFGFYGISSYNHFLLHGGELVPFAIPRIATPLLQEDLAGVASLHRATCGAAFGFVQRDPPWWEHLLKMLPAQGLEGWVARQSGEVVGYVLLRGNEAVELAARDEVVGRALLAHAASRANTPTLKVHAFAGHPLAGWCRELDVTLMARQCPYGGHMVRILQPAAVTEKLCQRVTQRAQRLGLSPQVEERGLLRVTWDGTRAHAAAPALPGFTETAALLGAAPLSEPPGVLDPPLAFNISVPDQL